MIFFLCNPAIFASLRFAGSIHTAICVHFAPQIACSLKKNPIPQKRDRIFLKKLRSSFDSAVRLPCPKLGTGPFDFAPPPYDGFAFFVKSIQLRKKNNVQQKTLFLKEEKGQVSA